MQQLTAYARTFESRCAERGEDFRRLGAMVRDDDLSGAPAVQGWLDTAAPERLRGAGAHPVDGSAPEFADAVQRHALAQGERLRAYPCVAEGIAAGRLALDVWFYEVHTGAVRTHRPETGTFQPL
ncbi:hypothetical protein [Streptomyces sp. NPDC048650]|uniref:hypothetical protein n=1 Tax=Streptomyces sp. NPDC048650 TaxID=3365583 RepID=UPI003720F081